MSDDVTKRINLVYEQTGQDRVLSTLKDVEGTSRTVKEAMKGLRAELKAQRDAGDITEKQYRAMKTSLAKYQGDLLSLLTVQKKMTAEDRAAAQAIKEAATAEAQRAKAVEASRQATYKAMVAQDKYNQSLNASNARGKSSDAAKGLYGSNDEAIRARQAESKAFSQGLQERLRGEQKLVASQAKLTAGSKQYAEHLPRLRYALYDVSSTFAIAGAAMLAFTGAVLGASITMDRRFADVIRTSGTYMDETGQKSRALRDDFNDLFTSLPADWATLTQIGTLGGQLGVASENLAEFTRLVTMFSSTTDVSAEAAATAFGRLSELLDVSASQYENLGSAILAVGTSSVATESQIINTSQQIASMGDFAGFSADQVIGLSSSLASLGIQPELARGTITRLFTNVSVAIANGGERLDEFGRLIGESGETFKKAWGEDASGTLERVFAGLSQIEGSGAITTLKDLGITAARDVPTILKLAQNHKLLSEQLDIAEEGFLAGTALQDQYGVVAETVSSKLLILKNSVQLLFAEIGGGSGALAPLIDGLATMVKGLASLAGNDVAQSIGLIVLGLTALSGVLALTAGGAARTAASMLALKTAMFDAAVTAGALSKSTNIASTSMWGLATSIKGVKLALISTGIGAVVVAIGSAIAYFVGKADEAKTANDALVASFSQALTEDTASGNGIRTLTVDLSEYGESAKTVTLSQQAWNRILAGASTYVDEMARAVREAAGEVDSLNVSIGEATLNEFIKEFTQDDKIRDLFKQGLIPEELDFTAWAQEWGVGGEAASQAYLDGFYKPDELRALVDELNNELTDAALKASGSAFLQEESARTGETLEQVYNRLNTELVNAQANYDAASARLGAYNTLSGIASDSSSALGEAALDAGLSQRVQGDAADEAGGALRDYTEAIREAIDAQTETISSALDVESAIASLGQSLGDGGNDWSKYTEAGRANLEALMGTMEAIATDNAGNPEAIANDFQALFNMLVNGGYASRQELSFLSASIAELAGIGKTKVVASGRDFSSFFSGWSSGADKAAKSTKAARKEVRTLLDYAGDLAKVWDRAFDIRFESTSTFDKITSTFQDLRDAAEESARSIADLSTEISGIQTDLGTQQYFLGIALEYGDSLRAAEIQQTILELQDDLEEKQKDLSKEQAKNSKVLQGNSKEAIANRGSLGDLTDQYLDHLKALAASGMSQEALAKSTEELRQDFLAQATALGFAEQDLLTYSAVFDDVTVAINNVPRNITVTANVDPALQALEEYRASLKDIRDAVAGGNYQPAIDPVQIQFKMPSYDQFMAMQAYIRTATGDARFRIAIPGGQGGQVFAEGGFTGRGGMYEPAGTVHRGEYVVPKRDVNQRTGLPYADAFQRLSKGIPGAQSMARGGYASGSASPGVVDLSARSIQHLANAVEKHLVLDGRIISQSTNRQNAFATQNGAY